MALDNVGEKLQNKLFRDAYTKLLKIFKKLDIPLDFTKPLSENEYEIEQAFKPAYDFILSYLETVALTSINFSRLQLKEINKSTVSIKNTEIEITVQWDKVDQSVLNFLHRGDSFSNPYFDLVTSAIASGNRNRLTQEYIAYVSGEKTLQDAYNFLRSGLTDDYRANLIVRGEMTQVWAIAQQESYRTAGTIRNAWNTRNDGKKVCPICAPLNGLETVIGEVFPGTRFTRPAAHGGCRCWLSPVPMTDEELEEFIKKGDTEKVKIRDKRPKKIKETSIQTPTVVDKPRPQTLEEFNKAFEEIELKKWDRYNKLVEIEIKEKNKLNKTSKANFAAMREFDRARRENADQKTLDLLEQNKIKAAQIHDEQIKKVSQIKKDKEETDKWVIEEQRKLLYADKPSSIKTKFLDSKVNTQDIKTGLEEIQKLLPETILGKDVFSISINATVNNTEVVKLIGPNREFYDPNDRNLYLKKDTTQRTVIHEFMHWTEYSFGHFNQRAVDFLNRRTAGESYEKLKDLFPNSGYGDNEVTKKDKFESPYMGKDYDRQGMTQTGRSTEILSMGVEYLWTNPREFLKKDPDYFEFILRDILERIK